MQLVAYGAQDIYLTGNPQITFFKVVYRRHTNFSMEAIQQSFNGDATFGRKVTCAISRNGDLIHRIYVQTTLPAIDVSNGILTDNTQPKAFRWLNWIGHVLIKEVTLEIGGQYIDKHYGDWLHIWNELSQSPGKSAGYAEMVGNVPALTQIYYANKQNEDCKTPEYTLYIPLQFWFCRNPGLALPLIALQYHEVKISLEFRTLEECIWAREQKDVYSSNVITKTGAEVLTQSDKALINSNIYVDYIYLDTDERRRFAQVAHEYLIEQLQFTGDEPVSQETSNIKLNFTHPVKELVWVIQKNSFVSTNYTSTRGGHQWFNYTDHWDSSFFTGTPEGAYGPGLVGGRGTQNIFHGLPTIGNVNTDESYGSLGSYSNRVGISGSHMYNGLTFADLLATSFGNSIEAASGHGDMTSGAGVDETNNPFGQVKLGSAIDPPPTLFYNPGIWGDLGNSLRLVDLGYNPLVKAKLQLNGTDRFSEREGTYFNLVQPYQHHTNCPAPGINVYSFALTPEDHQPSGTANFSRIDNAVLMLTLTTPTVEGGAKVRIYATNYNILRIMSGMGGLAYSN